MDTKFILYIHIFCGTIALLSGVVPMIAKKGSLIHTRSGWIYFWAMAGVCLSGLVMGIIIPGRMFFFYIALFSFYFTFTGYRSVKHKKQNFSLLDKSVAAGAMLLGVYMFIAGILLLQKSRANYGGIIFMIFGIFVFKNGFDDMKKYLNPEKIKSPKHDWFYNHLGRMIGSYIATFTAFCVVNIQFMPQIIVWLFPGLIGGIAIARWIKYYKNKFNANV